MCRTRTALVALTLAALSGCSGRTPATVRSAAPTASARPAPAAHPVARNAVIGRSVRGRPLVALTLGTPGAPRRLLVVGCIHGDEPAGTALALELLRTAPPASTEVVVVPDANPDGVAGRTRQNAHHVDLNRNFPYAWRPLGRPGDQQYSGPQALSEPESRALAGLIRSLRPTVSVWFHQPEGAVDQSGGSLAAERRFATLSGLPLRRLPRYPGSAVSWQDATWAGTTAFVVELPRHVSAPLGKQIVLALKDLERGTS